MFREEQVRDIRCAQPGRDERRHLEFASDQIKFDGSDAARQAPANRLRLVETGRAPESVACVGENLGFKERVGSARHDLLVYDFF
ncbi:hypothetical protein NE850_38355 [Paraburkholderia sp. USG1]|uniref:hypothetical protein n=1 Tax=Paraburkholderia sp. USG1 TaxID=2952268 RepID=UPI002857E30B|nr:hypothetical protein [Paraburkholderia sp. USG1]MDR8402189.1 hypothetical protein [Paraburkholderia sp. USG1]